MKLTLGFSPCPNDTFIFDALIHEKIDTEGIEFEVCYDDVETLNKKAFECQLDITKLSYHAFAHAIDNYALLEAGSALGFGVGPLLISRPCVAGHGSGTGAIEGLSKGLINERIGIPGKYTTANFLLGLAFPHASKKTEMVFSEIEDSLLSGDIDLGLIIHENRFTYAQKGLEKVIDLGQFWEKETGCPIPLGGIVMKRTIPAAIQTRVNTLIRRSIEYAFAHPGSGLDFIRSHAQEMDETVMYQHIELYVNKYSVDLGSEGRRAVEVLFEMAVKKGLIEPVTLPVFAAG